jgi:hypothetical protein
MGSAFPLDPCKQVVLDIELEMHFWRIHYAQAPFHRAVRTFDQYSETIKFGYDMYLLHFSSELNEVMAGLRQRYVSELPKEKALEWAVAEAVIRETWKRMTPEANYNSRSLRSQIPTPKLAKRA